MDFEIDNARMAWDWAARSHSVELLARAAGGVVRYYQSRVRHKEGEVVIAGALAHLEAACGQEPGRRGRTAKLLSR